MERTKLQRTFPYLIVTAIFFGILASYTGLERAFWLSGLTIGCGGIGTVFLWIADAKGEDEGIGLAAKLVSVVSYFGAVALLLFSISIVGKVIISPFWPSGYDDRPVENYRR